MPADERPLEGRVAVVTGGARGMGYEFGRAIADAGGSVALVDVLPDVDESAARLTEATGRPVVAAHCDVTDEASVAAAFDAVAGELGVVDALVNSAGVAFNAPAYDMTPDAFRRVVDINLTGTFLVCREFGRRLREASRPGSVVNVSSMSGQVVNVPQPQCAYNASKAGVAMLTKSLAVEWIADGIRVNAVAPGYVATALTKQVLVDDPAMVQEWVDRTPAGRMAEPADISPAVVFLLSDAAAYVVGQDVVIDGGYTAV